MELKWWEKGIVYQIYPRSFCDSNGDGVGDIPGIISKLDYLKDLGIDILWLTPVYASPNDDNGYDISDYKAIHPEFGSMADMDRLIAETKSRGIKIIMDLVINHTSDEHEWFKRAKAGDMKYKNYYIIKKGKDGSLPNNWGNFFAECPWEKFCDDEYFLHLFSKKQPDLNWHNPEVYEEIKDILRFWLDKGIAGFRCDVINVLCKESLADGKKQLVLTGREHYLSKEGTHDILRRLRSDVFDRYDCFTVGETVFVNLKTANDLCAPERRELDMVFAFEHMECDQIAVKWFKTRFKPEKLMNTLFRWQQGLEWNTLYFENHDQPRSVSRFGNDTKYRVESAKMLGAVNFTLKGTPFIYEGQEIGMTNGDFAKLSEIKDIESRNVDKMLKSMFIPKWLRWKLIRKTSRDNARTPMQWSCSENAGFTTGTPWLQINKNYLTVNTESDRRAADGIYAFYRSLIRTRTKERILLEGDFVPVSAKNNLYIYKRVLNGNSIICICNFSKKVKKIKPVGGKVLLSNYGISVQDGVMKPYEFIAVKEE